jgi:hypothetical protein
MQEVELLKIFGSFGLDLNPDPNLKYSTASRSRIRNKQFRIRNNWVLYIHLSLSHLSTVRSSMASMYLVSLKGPISEGKNKLVKKGSRD